MKRKNSYLQNLKFKPEFGLSWSSWYITNIRLVMLLILIVVPLGIASYVSLPRRLNPEVKIPIVTVSTFLPGASPDEVEKLITEPVENAISEVDDIKTYSSTSQENVSFVTIEFESSIANEDAERNVQQAINKVSDLPDDATTPTVSLIDFENQPITEIALTQTADSYPLLLRYSLELKDLLEESDLISKAVVTGNEKEIIEVHLSPTELYLYNLNPFSLSQQINSSTTSYPAGNVTTDTKSIPVSISKSIETIDDLTDTPIAYNTSILRLGQIADIKDKYDGATYSYLSDSEGLKRSISISLYKTINADIEAASDAANKILADYEKKHADVTVHYITNAASDITTQFSELGNNFAQTLVLVFVTLFIFLGLRQSTIVSLSIPITFLISFAVMNLTGLSMNFLTVFSLLLGLGLLVDDAIVVISAMTAYHRTGKFTKDQTAILVWKDFIVPIWSTTLTTVWAFIPLLLSSGIIGEFIKTIPIVVSATLIASTSVAVLITLPIMRVFLKPEFPSRVKKLFVLLGFIALMTLFAGVVPHEPFALYLVGILTFGAFIIYTYRSRSTLFRKKKRTRLTTILNQGFINSEAISNSYATIIHAIISSESLRKNVVAMTVIFSIISYLLVPLGFVKNEFFPKVDGDYLYVEIKLPVGTISSVTRDKALEVSSYINEHEQGIETQLIEVGKQTNLFAGSGAGSHQARLTLVLDKDTSSIELADDLRTLLRSNFGDDIQVLEQSAGPPAGNDIQIEFSGDDLAVLSRLADETYMLLENKESVINPTKSIEQSSGKYEFTIEKNTVSELGISNDTIGFWMRTYLSDFELGTIDGDIEKPIIFRILSETPQVSDLGLIHIPTQYGYVPLNNLGTFTLSSNPTQITHVDGVRTINVSAGVKRGFTIPEVNQEIESDIQTLSIPKGYSWKTGGVNEENQNSVNSILQAMILSAGLILATMVLQLGSFRKATIILLVIPLAISGVFYTFALAGIPLSFPALIGVLALFGIVVNNSIVVVEKINQNIAAGIKFKDAIVDAAASRVEPILFSSLTTILGLIPITISDPLWTGLGGAIIAGLTVSGIIMLFFIPVVYYNWFKGEYK